MVLSLPVPAVHDSAVTAAAVLMPTIPTRWIRCSSPAQEGSALVACSLTAQLSLLNEENPILVWGKDRRPRPPLTPEEERENAETRACLARAMEEWDNNQPWYKKLLGW